MKLTASGIAVLGLVIFGLACAPPAQEETAIVEEVPSTRDDIAALNDIVVRWDKGINGQDEEEILSIYADDPTIMPPFQPMGTGKDAVRAWLKDAYSQGLTVENFMSDARVSGDLAIMHGTFSLEVKSEGTTESVEDKGIWLGVFKRDADGAWRAKRNIWNSNLPPQGVAALKLPQVDVGEPDEPVCVRDLAELNDTFVAAFTEGDLATLVAIHAADAVRFPPGMPPVKGRAELASFFQFFFEGYEERDLTANQTGSRVEGDLGSSWGTFEFSYVSTGGDSLADQGKWVGSATRQANGCWVSQWTLWNSDLPTETTGA